MKTFARRVRVRQSTNLRNTFGSGRQRARLSVPRGSKIRIRQG